MQIKYEQFLPEKIECVRAYCWCNYLSVYQSLSSYVCKGVRGNSPYTVYPKKYAHGFCFAVLCCGYTLTDFPISIRLTSLALWQSNDCPSASKATLMNMDKYVMWIHYERLHNHNKAKHNKTVCIFLGIYCISVRKFCHNGFMSHDIYLGDNTDLVVVLITEYLVHTWLLDL